MAVLRWYPARFAGRCATCSSSFPEGTPAVYDGEAKKTTRCALCPDLNPAERRDVEKITLAAAAKLAAAEENKRRAAEAPEDLAALIERAGANLGSVLQQIGGHSGIAADLARHGIAVDTLVSALVHLAAADSTRSACRPDSWMAAAQDCARWGLIPTAAQDSPVYLFCRDTKAQKLACERTRWGFATQIARGLPDGEIVCGWTFREEALLGELAERVRSRQLGAQEEAQALRARLEAKKGERTADQEALAAGFLAWFTLDLPWPQESRGALLRLGKASSNEIEKSAYRHVLRREPVSDEERAHLQDLREDLEAVVEGLTAAEESLLAALRLPNWSSYGWYQASGEENERTIGWQPPSYALWERPPMDPTRLDGVPVVWWARLTYTEADGKTREIGFELSRRAVYERACAGGQVALSSAGLLVNAKNSTSAPAWLTWHGECGEPKVIRELLKANPMLFERFKALAAEVEISDEAVIEGETLAVVGRDHLAAVRKQIGENAPVEDFAAETERLRQKERVGAQENP